MDLESVDKSSKKPQSGKQKKRNAKSSKREDSKVQKKKKDETETKKLSIQEQKRQERELKKILFSINPNPKVEKITKSSKSTHKSKLVF